LSVYNRWGELLFSKSGNDVFWDGIFKNKLLQEDIYVWQISFIHPLELERKTMRGKVMLMQ
jgi:gliding motility-associated-like protein